MCGRRASERASAPLKNERKSLMYKSPSPLPEKTRASIAESLNARLADGLDLHSQIKVAHWNIKGPQFAALHPLFETFAVSLANHNDSIAERAVTLGGKAFGTTRHVSKSSRLPEYPQETTRDLEHVKLLAERIEVYLEGLRDSRKLFVEVDDADSEDLATGIIVEFEKHVWFLRASLET
ncbi:DNA starvation/stationary phase protection protein Dps [Myxococcus sp. CA039A]|uniref:DNA starvation/stationary phase protection protein Dps n=1 Tax=Myxococcus sp. CA039A TaxID=2741737 RepID=UPI00157AE1CC|nr:DNA starvation/stationary phase protection protein Dps [Myxococcus sp. CA039A]